LTEAIIVAIIVSIPPLLVALLTLRQTKIIHMTMNSRLDQLLKSSNAEARAEGVIEGRREK